MHVQREYLDTDTSRDCRSRSPVSRRSDTRDWREELRDLSTAFGDKTRFQRRMEPRRRACHGSVEWGRTRTRLEKLARAEEYGTGESRIHGSPNGPFCARRKGI